MRLRSAIWLNTEHTAANCEVFAEALNAWVPYTVSKNHLTGDAVAQEIWEALKSAVVQEPGTGARRHSKVARGKLVRDGYLKDTDVFMLVDYPITEERRAVIRAYRQYLRDLPDSEPEWYLKHIKTLLNGSMNMAINRDEPSRLTIPSAMRQPSPLFRRRQTRSPAPPGCFRISLRFRLPRAAHIRDARTSTH